MADAYICDAVRTPIGRYAGGLAPVRADDLGAIPLRTLMARNPGVDWEAVEDVIYGCANQAGEDNRNVARMALLLAGLPSNIPGSTVNRLCGSGMDAVGIAARAIKAGECDLMLAGGVESMTRAPYVQGKQAEAFGRAPEIYDTTIGWRFVNPKMKSAHGVDSMPETAENVAQDFQVSRADQDAFAWRSQQRAGKAQAAGRFAQEIVAVEIPRRKGDPVRVEHDEHPRPDTTLEALAKLPTPFRKDGGSVTAGNASGVNDGSAALIVASEAAVKKYGLTPRARVVAAATAGVAPRIMGFGPAPATRRVLEKAGLTLSEIDVIELERGLRGAGAGRHPRPRPGRRRRAREPERRRHRAWPPARHVRRAAGDDRGAGVAEPPGALRPDHDVHRRRPGHRHGRRTGLTKEGWGEGILPRPPHLFL
ncbi:acetyl-CoA C-acyltransferase [Dankookia sp. P2]|uniref:acetyl-CoA C-acyltransferase n=1 Tax=Dankookia sp. P2 TaxID=3423955 RepID=UPI003D6733DF